MMAAKHNSEVPKLSSKLKDLFTHKNWSTLWQTYTLVQQWPQVVGKNIAKKSEPAYILKDTLWVYVESSVLMQHMQPQKLSLLEKINDLLPEAGIQDIRWAMQPAQPVRTAKDVTRETSNKPTPEEKDAFEAMTSTVEDETCREALQKLWQTFHNR
jgi:hypothetical protein